MDYCAYAAKKAISLTGQRVSNSAQFKYLQLRANKEVLKL